ncbi:MAG TPA: type I glyceraldehyde-3-phosphate dehydrogenase [Gammaproteobacteria bacterium]|jgi:glyceraldehyde 3-phosphate dehydrogenase|nr:ArsJ-associated glyceraldehyde-3-phosphate dehydrogenase [Pseudomonadota bacterium]HAY45344.1 type I glyceraldehyde-3-phosphate dehydrogenase [Gammaproteobacteria bacterium]
MKTKVGINGFGRIGRLFLRAAWANPNIEIIQVNDPGGDNTGFAHLLNFDSVHGQFTFEAIVNSKGFEIDDSLVSCSHNRAIDDTDWSGCDIVVEASGRMRKSSLLQAYLDQGVDHVVVSAPVKEESVLNVVMGVNDHHFDPKQHPIVTAASCTTNCLAPIVKVVSENYGIKHGSMTSIHSVTNTQRILDSHHKDLRRARSSSASLIPTTTGSASAITAIFPELEGKLNGHAIRIPLSNASLIDCVFELERETNTKEANNTFEQAAKNELDGILGYEERPLVSIDYRTDPRSAVVDAEFTTVINKTQLKVYAWYDNEWGYANRVADLVNLVHNNR